MTKKFIIYFTILLFIIKGALSQNELQGQKSDLKKASKDDSKREPREDLRPIPGENLKHHPNDEQFFDMERKGKKPKEIKFEEGNTANLIVDVIETKDNDYNENIITNKSTIKIIWSLNNTHPNNNNFYNNPNNNNKNMDSIEPTVFKIKLLSNVTQDSETKLFYPYAEREIGSNLVQINKFEYKIPKLDENYVYNIAVIADPVGDSKNNSIGLSRSLIYKLYDTSSSKDNDNSINENNKKGINPIIFVGIGIAGVALVAIAFFLSKKISKNDNQEEKEEEEIEVVGNGDDDENLPLPNSMLSKNIDGNDEIDISVINDNNSEVSWSNLEIAKESNQTKNNADDHIYRTLDRKGYKRNNNESNEFVINQSQIYKVVRMFIPSDEDEIRLNIGDDAQITTIFEDGWCEGLNKSSNEYGVFPRACIVEAEQYAEMFERTKNSLLPTRKRSKHNSITRKKYNYKSLDYMANNKEAIPEVVEEKKQ